MLCFPLALFLPLVRGNEREDNDIQAATLFTQAQINTDQVVNIGRNALYFEDYILAIQYFNQAIKAKPFLAEPYFYRAVAKISLEDYQGAEQDAGMAIERNPFIVDAYQVRGVSRQNLGNFKGAVEDYDAGLKLMPEAATENPSVVSAVSSIVVPMSTGM